MLLVYLFFDSTLSKRFAVKHDMSDHMVLTPFFTPLLCCQICIAQTGLCINVRYMNHKRYIKTKDVQSQLTANFSTCHICRLVWEDGKQQGRSTEQIAQVCISDPSLRLSRVMKSVFRDCWLGVESIVPPHLLSFTYFF